MSDNQDEEKINAQVIAVFPDKVRIVVDDLEDFKIAEESLKVGSYLKIADNENAILIAIIENFQIAVSADGKRDYISAWPKSNKCDTNQRVRGIIRGRRISIQGIEVIVRLL